MITKAEQRRAAKRFSEYWKDKGYEKGESQTFWLTLLRDIFGIERPEEFVHFEEHVKLDQSNYLDVHIPSTHVIVEQKGRHIDLNKAIRQSDGSLLSPYQQAFQAAAKLPYSKRPRWIVTCNFQEFHIHDMEKPGGEPEIVLLSELENDYYRLFFLVKEDDQNIKKQTEVSLQAGELVGVLYDALHKQYRNPDDPQTLRNLNILCVRLVFCFYAEDSGIFGKHNMFQDYLRPFESNPSMFRKALLDLFRVLDLTTEERAELYLEDDLAAFPYVNGGLFENDDIVIPFMNSEIIDIILNKASASFNWSNISPTIFGAVFESTLNPESRRAGGMHYTSIENIHKVIDPLFMDALNEEFQEIMAIGAIRERDKNLTKFQNKLASLKFLDPAAGSGNFLTETYLSLRRLENKVIAALRGPQIVYGDAINPIMVSIGQFYGIEINDFAVTVARTALWIAESQMMSETIELIHTDLDFLPLTSNANIVEGNALRMDWNDVVPKTELSYIMGNPPFIGKKEQTKTQKDELLDVFGKKLPGIGNLDYVTAWYRKAVDYIQNKSILVAFVSTNSITQGEQVPIFWSEMLRLNVIIQFAYQSFVWNSEATDKAHVHCVIIGFSCTPMNRSKIIYINEIQSYVANNINPYLVDAPNILVKSRLNSLSNVAPIYYGSMPIDNGHLILDENDVNTLLQENPENAKFIKPYAGGYELINNKKRWCLWLAGFNPDEIRASKFVMDRVNKTYEFRKVSNRKQTNELAKTPYLFGEIRQPDSKMIVIPKVSSERRKYIPISIVSPTTIVNGSALIVPEGTLFDFGILMSNVHVSWMKYVGGRMKSDYQYSGSIVYNNFPWPQPTAKQQEKIAETAQAILDARELYPNASLADLYDELTMPPELRKAHQDNDRAVMEAYGFNWRTMTESECVAELMKIYQDLSRA